MLNFVFNAVRVSEICLRCAFGIEAAIRHVIPWEERQRCYADEFFIGEAVMTVKVDRFEMMC